MFQRVLATLVTGFLLVTADNVTAAAPGNPSKAEARQVALASVFADARQAAWIRDGKSVHVIYVFFDPNCPYCHKVFEMLRPQVQRGEVELRWVVVGKLMATSTGKAAAMLEAKDPTEAFYRNERGFSQETGSFGGIEEEPLPREDTLRKLQANMDLLKRTGFDAVPALLYRTREGKAELLRGAPPAAFLDKLVKELE